MLSSKKSAHWICNYRMLFLSMSTFRLDRTAFKGQTATEAADHASWYKKLSWQQRLSITAYLNSIAFNYPANKPPRMDKTVFKAKERKN
jgi:hypothetical protein